MKSEPTIDETQEEANDDKLIEEARLRMEAAQHGPTGAGRTWGLFIPALFRRLGMTKKAKDRIVPVGLIQLSHTQQRAIQQWAADDRLWTTEETVALNLETFARLILNLSSSVEAAQSSGSLPETNKVRCDTGGENLEGMDPMRPYD